jgi:hypothetical protein
MEQLTGYRLIGAGLLVRFHQLVLRLTRTHEILSFTDI